MSPPRPARDDERTLGAALEAVGPECPDAVRQLLRKIVRTLDLHDERLTRIEETPEIKELLA